MVSVNIKQMIVDGKALAARMYEEVKTEVAKMSKTPHLAVLTCAPNFETQKYLELKKKKATEVGIVLNVIELLADAKTEEAVATVRRAVEDCDGIIVQLPLPSSINTDEVLAEIPKNKDTDAMHYEGEETEILPPVVGAIKVIAEEHSVNFSGKKVAVVGAGKLVGKPAALWAAGQGANVITLTKETENNDKVLQQADIIISGAGVSGLLKPENLKEGVVIFDGGTSEEGGELRGDALPECATKASLFTPVPGGIGPLTVAVLLKNVMLETKQ